MVNLIPQGLFVSIQPWEFERMKMGLWNYPHGIPRDEFSRSKFILLFDANLFSNLFFVYDRFCFECGHIAKSDAKGNLSKITEYPFCPFDELGMRVVSISLSLIDWRSFHQIWEQHLPKL